MKVVFGILFLFFSNTNLEFGAKKLTQRLYSTAKALSIAKTVELINKHKFIKIKLDGNSNIFFINITKLEAAKSVILRHTFLTPFLASLQQKKPLSEILRDFAKCTNIFSQDLVMKVPENTGINKHKIELVQGK